MSNSWYSFHISKITFLDSKNQNWNPPTSQIKNLIAEMNSPPKNTPRVKFLGVSRILRILTCSLWHEKIFFLRFWFFNGRFASFTSQFWEFYKFKSHNFLLFAGVKVFQKELTILPPRHFFCNNPISKLHHSCKTFDVTILLLPCNLKSNVQFWHEPQWQKTRISNVLLLKMFSYFFWPWKFCALLLIQFVHGVGIYFRKKHFKF